MNARPSWSRRLDRLRLGLIVLAIGAPAVAHAAEVQIAIVADGNCPAALRDRVAEQVADIADRVSWSCLESFDTEEPFRSPDVQPGTLQIWVDVTPHTEARLTLRDVHADRFVVRRIPLPRGLDEIGREEIGQIVRSAALAVLAGPAETMNREQARAEISRWKQPATTVPSPQAPPKAPLTGEPDRPSPRAAGSTHLLQISAMASARGFATSIPLVEEVGVAAAIVRPGTIGFWIEAAYQLPAQDSASPVGVKLDAVAVRGGLGVSFTLSPILAARLGAGGGFTRTSFTPLGSGGAVTIDPSGEFFTALGRVFAGLDVRIGTSVVGGVAVSCDAVGEDVHYDLHQSDGTTQRVLTPFRLQPGVALQIGWSP